MQLRRPRVLEGLCAACLLSCEPGGVTVIDPNPPDAVVPDTSSTGMADEGLPGEGSDSDGGDAGVTLVPAEAMWRVSATPGAGWTAVAFDDSSWAELAAPIGRGYDDATPWPEDGSVYLRHTFSDELPPDARLELRLRRDDGAIAYLDGVEVARFNVEAESAGIIAEVQEADGSFYFFASPPVPEGEGPHVLAVEVHQGQDPDLVFDARLRTLDPAAPPQSVLIQFRTRSYGGMFAPENVGAVWIEDMTGNFVRSVLVWGKVRREHLVGWGAASNDNRVDAMTSATAESHGSWVAEWDLRDADGAEVPPGVYVAHFELVEENANEGDPPGPTTSVSFSTATRGELHTGGTEFIEDVVVFVP